MPIPSLPLFLAAQQHAQNDPAKVAVIDATKQQSFTYTQLLEDAAGLRKQITEHLGLTDLEERRIAFLVPNGYDYVATSWAIWAAGGVCVPLCRLSQLLKSLLMANLEHRHQSPCKRIAIRHWRFGPIPSYHPSYF